MTVTEMKPSEVFAGAQVVLLERGHTKGTWEDERNGRVCIVGACLRAMFGVNPVDLDGEHYRAVDVLAPWLRAAIGRHTGRPSAAIAVEPWNDRKHTTAADAMAVLHGAEILAKEAGQ